MGSSTNITLAVDARIERAREVARQQGTSLNALLREYIEELARVPSGAALMSELERLWNEGSGHSGGEYKFRREGAYEDRIRG